MTLGHVTAFAACYGEGGVAHLGVALLPLFVSVVVCVSLSFSVCGKVETFDIRVCQHALLIRRMAGRECVCVCRSLSSEG